MGKKKGRILKPVKDHEEARQRCCAACGRGGAQEEVKPATEELIRKYAHSSYSVKVQSYPLGLCTLCKKHLYLCRSKGAPPREAWAAFKPEDISIARVPPGTQCQCPMCHTARFNPVGTEGKKGVVSKPVINPEGGKMECESQSPVRGRGRGSCRGVCGACGQVTGRGLRHPCSPGDARAALQGRTERGRSIMRKAEGRRKRNLTVMALWFNMSL